MAGAILVLAILALLMRLVYYLIAPALPFMLGLAFVILIIVHIIRRRQGW
jgi:hypothetical protein